MCTACGVNIIIAFLRLISRFVYGRLRDEFKDISVGVELYKFSNYMQIDKLTKELEKIFEEGSTSDILFAVFDLYSMLSNESGLKRLKKVTQ